MIEAAIIFVPVLILVMCLLSLGFFFYQTAIVNSAAAEIADTVAENIKFTELDVNEETLTLSDFQTLRMFRSNFGSIGVGKAQKDNAKEYADWRIPLSSLGFGDQNPDVEFSLTMSGPGRYYVEVKVSLETDIFLGGILRYSGILDENNIYSAVAYAECVDLTAYTSMINFVEHSTKALNFLDPVGRAYGNIKDLYDGISDLFDSVIN